MPTPTEERAVHELKQIVVYTMYTKDSVRSIATICGWGFIIVIALLGTIVYKLYR